MAEHEDPSARQKMAERVLIVDDDKNILDAYRRRLSRALHVDICNDPVDALQLLADGNEYAVIISDFLMPKLNGVQFLSKCKEMSPQSIRMMLTGISDFGTSVDAVNSGNVFRFLIKPCPHEVLGQALIDGIRQYRLEIAEGKVLRDTLRETVRLAVDAATMVDPATFADTRRLSGSVAAAAAALEPDHAAEIEIAWHLSHLGLLTAPPELTAKQRGGAALTDQEARLLEKSRKVGAEIARRIPQLESIAAMIESDGGAPKGARLSGAASSKGARILSLFRAVAALTAEGVPENELASRLKQDPHKFDAELLKAFDSSLAESGSAGFPTAVSIEELQPGDVLAADVCTADGRLLASTGTELRHLLIERIRGFATTLRIEEPITVLRPNVTVDLT